ncbi:TonB-dependent siderophore receptor [Erythrobacter sp. JK5]|uniref:TonB-dependent receptor n=1 Tax=Erythrobacter sp. JK5 TaxID=2829500 RepID=UPI001BABF0F7|nr:TonB-dependent siderophore receptor [Erythrobacter sp. JK5]QUL36712.1 TonB-dependent siderophore receptor [Erythrobacter sp. JK5]
MIRRLSRASLLLGCAAICAPLAAETTSEAEQPEREYLPSTIVVSGEREDYANDDGSSGTKTPTPVIDVPQGISFITSDQLEDQSIRQLGEAVRYIPGVSLETGEGHRDEIFIRGQESTADFYVDGLRDDAQYYRSLYNVDRVEVLKGANALIFGRGGGGGVVNRVSKRARINGFAASADASVDTFGAFALLGDVNATLSESAAVRLNATYDAFDNNRDFFDGYFVGISPTATFELGPDTRLFATYSYDYDTRTVDRGNPSDNGRPLFGFRDTLFGDRDFNETEAETHIGRVRIEHDFSTGLSANASVQYADYDKVYANILPTGLVDVGGVTSVRFTGYEDSQDRQNFIAQANLVGTFETGAIGHTLLAGIEFVSQDSFNGRRNAFFSNAAGGTTSAFVTPLTDVFAFPAIGLTAPVRARDSELGVFSAYIQDQVAIGEHVEIIAGLRYERFDLETVEAITGVPGARIDEEFSPRVGLIVKPQDNLSIYASYATSFLPQSGDQFFLLTPTEAAFEPERFTNYELGVKWAPTPDLIATAAIFRLDRTNTRATDPNNTGLTVLTGESRVEGFELALTGSVTGFWQANLGYTWLDGELRNDNAFGSAGARLQQLPEHQITAWNRFDLTEQFGLGLGVIHQSQQFASFSNTVILPSYWRFDAAAYYTVSDRVSLQVNIENLFDEDYFASAHGDSNLQPGKPFGARFGIRVAM